VDTARIPIDVSWESLTRRIRIVPRVALNLRETYTVQLAPGIATATGHALGQTSLWQFTTNSLRRPEPALPLGGAGFESPFATLAWAKTDAGVGSVSYELYVDADSAVVAARGVMPRTLTRPHYLPGARWTMGARYYWAVTAVNATTGERLSGAVRAFTIVSAGTPIDSLVVDATDWSYLRWDLNEPRNRTQFCRPTDLVTGSLFVCTIRWPLRAAAGQLRLAGAVLTTAMNPSRNAAPSIWAGSADWSTCALGYPGPPFFDSESYLADGIQQGFTNQLRYESDRLTTHFEAASRVDDVYGYVLRSGSTLAYGSPTYPVPSYRPVLRLYYYRLPPAPGAPAAPAVAAAAPTAAAHPLH
jgi:hypothetical protein